MEGQDNIASIGHYLQVLVVSVTHVSLKITLEYFGFFLGDFDLIETAISLRNEIGILINNMVLSVNALYDTSQPSSSKQRADWQNQSSLLNTKAYRNDRYLSADLALCRGGLEGSHM